MGLTGKAEAQNAWEPQYFQTLNSIKICCFWSSMLGICELGNSGVFDLRFNADVLKISRFFWPLCSLECSNCVTLLEENSTLWTIYGLVPIMNNLVNIEAPISKIPEAYLETNTAPQGYQIMTVFVMFLCVCQIFFAKNINFHNFHLMFATIWWWFHFFIFTPILREMILFDFCIFF